MYFYVSEHRFPVCSILTSSYVVVNVIICLRSTSPERSGSTATLSRFSTRTEEYEEEDEEEEDRRRKIRGGSAERMRIATTQMAIPPKLPVIVSSNRRGNFQQIRNLLIDKESSHI